MWVGHENLGPEKFPIVLRQASPLGEQMKSQIILSNRCKYIGQDRLFPKT
jgi:hypothetical protein